MRENIRDYARIGLVHHMLYPESITDPDYHAKTLERFIRRGDIETLDCCIPYGDQRRERLTGQVRTCGKEVVYALHLFPNRKISLASQSFQEQSLARLVIKDQIEMAAAIGASGFVFVSGADIPEQRDAARRCFKDFCRWFCSELKPYGITALLEPFDRDIDKKFLYGPIIDCVELVQSLADEGHGIGIELDIAHLPLMGETLSDAIHTCADQIQRVHLGNCVLKDRTSPLYGDYHPPIGLPGGEIDVPELAVVLEELLSIGYLSRRNRGALILEMIPYPGLVAEETIQYSFGKLDAAWRIV